MLLLLSTEEDFTLWEKSSNETGESGNTRASPEERAPSGVGDEVQVDEGGDEVADSVSLLHHTAGNTTGLDGKVLEGSGGGETPDTSHADTEETSESKELGEGLDETGAEGEDRDKEEVSDQRPFSAVAIGEETKDDLWTGR